MTWWPVGLLNRTPFKANSTRASLSPFCFPPSSFPVLSRSPNAHIDQLSEHQCPFNYFIRYNHVVVTLQVPMRPAWKHHQLKILENNINRSVMTHVACLHAA